MNAVKTLAALALTLASTSAFALGQTNTKAIDSKMTELKEAGFECEEKWPEDFREAKGGNFVVSLSCKHATGQKKSGKISYHSANLGSRCADFTATSITVK